MVQFPYEMPAPAASLGMKSAKLEQALTVFHEQHSRGLFPGGQIAVRRGGKPALNHALGIGRGARESEGAPPLPVQKDTPFPVLSCGKPLASIVIAHLEERGLIDPGLPVAHYFPEFGRRGKQAITVDQVLTHRSGLRMPALVRSVHNWVDRGTVRQALAETVPYYPPGTLAYQPYEYGWILAELVLLVDGRTLPDYFELEFARPLGLPNLRFGLGTMELDTLAFTYWLGGRREIVAGTNVAETYEAQNSVEYLDSGNPSVCLVSDAASLAAFYDFLLAGGVTRDGRRILREQTIRRFTRRAVRGWDRSLRTFISLGRGFTTGALHPSAFGWANTRGCFGHAGGFCALAFGDYERELSVSIITNGSRGQLDFLKRFLHLAGLILSACD